MGASHVGEIRDLAENRGPEIGVVTAIGHAHVVSFGSLRTTLQQAKGELVESFRAAGFAVLSGDDPIVERLAERAECPVMLVGENGTQQIACDFGPSKPDQHRRFPHRR